MMGVIIGFALLVILMFRKIPITVAAPISALVMAAFSGINVMKALTGSYMTALVGFIKAYFILFLVSAIFARLMGESGAAYAIGNWLGKKLGARFAIWGVSLAAMVLTYGGVSVFVLVFTIYPIALVLFRDANISRKLIPGAIAAGAFTVPNFLWGSPGLVNVIPTTYFGTTVRSGALISVICSIFLYVSANAYLVFETKRMAKKGETFIPTPKIKELLQSVEEKKSINPVIAIIPILVILIALDGFKIDINIAMFCGVVAAYICFWKNLPNKLDALVVGSENAISSVMNTASAVGMGGVARVTPAFNSMLGWVSRLGGSPLISWGIAVVILTIVSGSGSGGVALAVSSLGHKYLSMGLDPVILHKVASFAGILCVPWNGVIVTTLSACELTHKEAYMPLFMISFVLALVNLALGIGLGMVMY